MRPARLSEILPAASACKSCNGWPHRQASVRIRCQCFQRAATYLVLERIVAKETKWLVLNWGNARFHGNSSILVPPRFAKADRFGVFAVSNSVLPPGSIGKPPSHQPPHHYLEGFFTWSSRVRMCISMNSFPKCDNGMCVLCVMFVLRAAHFRRLADFSKGRQRCKGNQHQDPDTSRKCQYNALNRMAKVALVIVASLHGSPYTIPIAIMPPTTCKHAATPHEVMP